MFYRLRRAAVALALASFVVAAPATAQSTQDQQYGPPSFLQDPPGESGLPFTGQPMAALILGGLAAIALGLVLRHVPDALFRGRRVAPPWWAAEHAWALPPAPVVTSPPSHARLNAPEASAAVRPARMLQCDVCGRDFDANAYEVSFGTGGTYDSVECALADGREEGRPRRGETRIVARPPRAAAEGALVS